MVKHIVFMSFADKNEVEIVKSKLLGMRDKMEGLLKEIEVGLNFTDSDRAYDLALITVFESKEDLKTYASHEAHLPVVEYIKSVNGETKVVDFEF